MIDRNRRMARATVLMVGVTLLGIQMIRPARENPPTDPRQRMESHVTASPGVLAMLKRSCFDCHSFETRWPFYSAIAPASWIIARDVRMGREDLNFSAWLLPAGREPTPVQNLGGICHDVREAIMPPRSYLTLHPSARLTPADRDSLCNWALEQKRRLLDSAAAPLPTVSQPKGFGQ